MNPVWMALACGLFLGGVLGMLLMAVFVLSGRSDEDLGRIVVRDMDPAARREELLPDEST